ncbi:MAG: hypothetical protein OK454_02610 [Thaumarchaeota archaeon]|nr:hypothetical protein [Nitrososphaerota archaeon]
MKIARSHILHMLEYALDTSGPVSYTFAKYTIDASPYRTPGRRGNSGVRVSWRKNAAEEKPAAEKKAVKNKKPAKAKAKKKKGKK